MARVRQQLPKCRLLEVSRPIGLMLRINTQQRKTRELFTVFRQFYHFLKVINSIKLV